MNYGEIQKPEDKLPLYPDIEEHGSLASLLNSLFSEIGSPLRCEDSPLFKHVGGRVEQDNRFSQLSIAVQQRLFHFDFWQDGVCLVSLWCPDPNEVAQVIHQLVTLNRNPLELEAEFSWFQLDDTARSFLEGPRAYTEKQWQFLDNHLREHEYLQPLHRVLVLARANPQLGLLYPFTSLSTLRFSLCTGYPFDTPFPAIWMASNAETGEPIYAVRSWKNNAPTEFIGEAEGAVKNPTASGGA